MGWNFLQGDSKPGGGLFGFLSQTLPSSQQKRVARKEETRIRSQIATLPRRVQQQLPELPSAPSSAPDVMGNFLKGAGQYTARLPETLVRSGIDPFISGDQSSAPTTGLRKALYGEGPVQTYQKRISGNQEKGGVLGALAVPLGIAGGILDVSGGGSILKSLGRQAGGQLIKATTEQEVKRILKDKIPPQVAERIAPAIAKTKDPNIIDNLLSGQNKIPSPAPTIQDVLPPTPVKVPTPAGQGSARIRAFPESVKTSQIVQANVPVTPQQLAESIKTIPYFRKLQATSFEQAAKEISANPQKALEEAFVTANKTIGDVEVGKRITLLADALQNGRLETAGKISEALAPAGTKLGQAVSMFNTINRTTPSGAFHWAKKLGADDSIAGKFFKRATEIDGMATSEEKNLAKFQLMKDIRQLKPSSIPEQAVDFWRSMLLTAPTTTGGNILSNTIEAGIKQVAVNPVATGFDVLTSLFTGKRSRSLTYKGLGKGATEGTQKASKYIKTGFDESGAASKYQYENVVYSKNKVGKAAEKLSGTVYKGLAAQDLPFRYAEINHTLQDLALTAAKNKGLKGAERETFINKFLSSPPKSALERANEEGARAVFGNETTLGTAAGKVREAMGPAGKVVIPFSQVPSSIATRVLERSPLGYIKASREIVKSMKGKGFDQRAFTESLANATVGSVGAVVMGKELANHDMITLGYPSDSKEQELWKLEGKQAYSIKLGNKWLSLNYVQPFGSTLAYGAAYSQARKEGKDSTDAIATASAQAAKSITGQSFLQGVSGALEAVQSPERSAGKYIKQLAGSLTPNIIKSGTRSVDPYIRTVSNPIEAFKATLPGLRQTLPVEQNAFGKPQERKTSTLNSFLNPLRPSDVKETPLINELRRLKDAGEGVGVSTVQRKMTFDGIDTTLTSAQQDELNKKVGNIVENRWNQIISRPSYQNLSAEKKSSLLRSVHSKIMKQQKNIFAKENNLGRYSPTYRSDKLKLRTIQ